MDNNINTEDKENILVEKYIISLVDYENYENWLEEKESEGWNLREVKYTKASIEAKASISGEHIFHKGQERKIRYCLDYKFIAEKGYEEIFKDFGWNLVSKGKDYWLWSMEYEGERPEAFDRIDLMKERCHKYISSLIRDIILYSITLMCMILLFTESTQWSGSFYIIFISGYLVARVIYRWSDLRYIGVYLKKKRIIEGYRK
ncbi:DUF2812 domain-containing protein [Clostridium paraputrificum]|uniref:DUF2812 domain-containing protein n=1 Tax=Clostridium TaxID=1485 RepID=UPI003D34EA45